MSRQQKFMHQALTRVNAIADVDKQKAFGRVCHGVPGWILNNGLAETVGFLAAKKGPAGNAWGHQEAFDTVAAILGKPSGDLVNYVAKSDMNQYMIDTLTVLDAWIFYKRFAVSILKVEAGDDSDDEGGDA